MKTKAKKKYNLRTHIRSALRKIWMFSPMRREAINRIKISNGVYQCPVCKGYLPNQKAIEVDHVVKVTPSDFDPTKDPTQWGILIKNLLYMDSVSGLVAMCKKCHEEKTGEERNEVKAKKAKSPRLPRAK